MSEALTEEYIDSLKVADLRKELKDRDLATTGKKAELVDRLKEFLQQNEGAGGEDSTDMKVEETSAAAEEPISGKRKAEKSDDESEQKQEGSESATTKKTKVGNEEPEAAATKEESLDTGKEASSVIVVSGFVRPFRFQAAEELFQKHGKVQSFWMNRFRTHAYVVYDDISSAQAASAAVEGLAWPAENGAKLSANFSNEEELETAKKESAAPVGVAAVAAASAAAAADRERKPAGDNEKDNEEDDKDAEEEEDLSNALYTKTEPSLMYIPLTEEQVAAKRRGEFVAPKSTVVPNNQPKKKRNRRRQRGGNPDRRDRGRGDNRDRRDRDRGFDRRDRDRGGDRRERDRGGRSTAWEERRGGSRKYDRDEKDFKSLKTGRVGIFGYDK